MRGQPPKYPLATMQPGECIKVTCDPSTRSRTRQRLNSSWRTYVRYHGLPWRFTTKTYENYVELWRVS